MNVNALNLAMILTSVYLDVSRCKRTQAQRRVITGFLQQFARATFDRVWGLSSGVGAAGWAALSKSIGEPLRLSLVTLMRCATFSSPMT